MDLIEKIKGETDNKKIFYLGLIFIIAYKIILDLNLGTIKIFQVDMFKLNVSYIKLVESYILLVLSYYMIPKKSFEISPIIINCLYLMAFVPTLTVYSLLNLSRAFMYAVVLFWFIIFLLCNKAYNFNMPKVIENFEGFKGRFSRFNDMIMTALFIIVFLYAFITLTSRMGLIFNFELSNVYAIRSSYYLTVSSSIVKKLNWVAYIINPLFFALFIKKRYWINFSLSLFLQYYLFSATGLKAYLFVLVWVAVLMVLVRLRHSYIYLIAFIALVTLGSTLAYWVLDIHIITGLFVRRTLLLPARLSFYYHSFFSTHPYICLSNDIFKYFIKYPYKLAPGYEVSIFFFNNPTMNSCNGIVGDGFANFGYIGMIVWALIISFVFMIMDLLSRNKDKQVAISVVAMSVVALLNSPLMTDLTTHGILLGLIIIFLLPRKHLSKYNLRNDDLL